MNDEEKKWQRERSLQNIRRLKRLARKMVHKSTQTPTIMKKKVISIETQTPIAISTQLTTTSTQTPHTPTSSSTASEHAKETENITTDEFDLCLDIDL